MLQTINDKHVHIHTMPTVNGQVSKQISADEDRLTSQLRDRQTD